MTKSVDIYFNDLNERGQRKMLEAVGVFDPADMNWDMDILPLFTMDFEVGDEN